ncbi:aldehyde dehydrogenase family protein [Salmonella enterica]|nr:aldehyde dehydrogenase family protein [Salmonella enterica]
MMYWKRRATNLLWLFGNCVINIRISALAAENRSNAMLDIVNFINGQHIRTSNQESLWSVNPATEARIATVNISGETDIDRAVQAARCAFEKGPWPQMTIEERASFLHMVADAIEENMAFFARHECEDTGFLAKMCLHGHLPRAVEHFRFFAEEGKRFVGQAVPVGNAYLNITRHVPQGVVAIMTPWNGPLSVSSINLAAALITGNTVVLKPSELAPLTHSFLGQIFQEIGLPPGVVNIVHGAGEPTGQVLIQHPDINMFCFIGGTTVGKAVLHASSQTVRRSLLELGGKSPTVILQDAPLEQAIDGALVSAFSSNGQVCTAGSRIIVEKSIANDFCHDFIERTNNIIIGDPFDENSEMGPMISARHRENILNTIAIAQKEGGILCTGGVIPAGLQKGYYLKPTVFTDVRPESSLARQETFGPVVSIFLADDEDHALSLANDTRFGLAGTVWSRDTARALAFAGKLCAGNIGINTPFIRDLRCPFGGLKESGIGAVGGTWSLAQYTQVQTLCLPVQSYSLPAYGRKN